MSNALQTTAQTVGNTVEKLENNKNGAISAIALGLMAIGAYAIKVIAENKK